MLDQGDILNPVKVKKYLPWWDDEEKYPIIILTPTCDIIHDKVNHHRFGILEPFDLFFTKLFKEIIGEGEISQSKKNKLELTVFRTDTER